MNTVIAVRFTQYHRGKHRAFTLVELLVTIAILAILGTILIAVVGNVRQSAKKTQSMSNLRQIGMAMNLYATENQGKLPEGYFYKKGEGERYWTWHLEPYIERLSPSNEPAENIYVSPLVDKYIKEGSLKNGSVPSTYSAHGILCPDTSNYGDEDPRINVSTISNPSELILVGEATLRSNNTYASATFKTPSAFYQRKSGINLNEPIPTDTDKNGTGGALRYRANGAALVTFVDGHVEAMEKGTVKYRNIVIAP